ncbi:MAG TPA: M15 family metallopeptidase [Legionellaceae bacterium]|nr:M15 family metallopeptidase [Legionellaceae bacterium]
MKKSLILLVLLAYAACIFSYSSQKSVSSMFKSHVRSIPKSIANKMQQYSWHKECPVTLSQLAYVQVSYWGFDQKPHQGELIVHKELAEEVVTIFKSLFQHRFPIHSMRLIEHFQGNDALSMAANNTSAFNCRPVIDRPGEFSQHSYGRAIDINPLLNPYINGQNISPPEGNIYQNRHQFAPGKIVKDDFVFDLFIKHGWDWGGLWFDVQDYQHFEKRAHGEKRNPYGY